MKFLNWHYTKGVDYYLNVWVDKVTQVYHYFSPVLLIKTLFAPWKRLSVGNTGPGFNFKREFENFTYNLISRFIGAFVRITLFILGLFLMLILLSFGVFGLVGWLILPPVGLLVYQRRRLAPEYFIAGILKKAGENKNLSEIIFANEAGEFVAAHLGIEAKDLAESVIVQSIDLNSDDLKSYEDLMRRIADAKLFDVSMLERRGLSQEDIIVAASWWDEKRREMAGIREQDGLSAGIGMDLLYGYTPTLDTYSTDLSKPQPFYHRLIGRENVVTQMGRNLSAGQSVLLIGEPGVGKTTVVMELAHRAATGQLGTKLLYKKLYELDYNALLSDTTDLNSKKSTLAKALDEAANAGNIVLVIKDIHRITNREVEGYDFTDVFEEKLTRGSLSIVSVGTRADYERFIARNIRLRKYLKEVVIEQPSAKEAFEITLDLALRYENEKGLTIHVPAVRKILSESDRYITDTPFPEKALELLEAVCVFREQNGGGVVTVSDVNAVLQEKTGISFESLSQSEKDMLSQIEEIIHRRLINQEAAVSLIGKSLRARAVQAKKEDRPLGSFLFLGPTGVGKTETAKTLAEVYYGSEDKMLRFDMAEYSGADGLGRLLGSPAKGEPGLMTTAIKNNPASLLLLDEFEKASAEVRNIFLTLLDEGVVSDAFGKKVVGKHLFIIATSNAGSEYIRTMVSEGISGEDLQKSVVNNILEQGTFSPELLNRFDGVIVYEPLGKEELYQIAKLMFEQLAKNFKVKNNIQLEASEDAVRKLAEDGFDPAFGARPMRRIIELELGDILGKAVLSGEVSEEEKILITTSEAGDFKLEKLSQ